MDQEETPSPQHYFLLLGKDNHSKLITSLTLQTYKAWGLEVLDKSTVEELRFHTKMTQFI